MIQEEITVWPYEDTIEQNSSIDPDWSSFPSQGSRWTMFLINCEQTRHPLRNELRQEQVLLQNCVYIKTILWTFSIFSWVTASFRKSSVERCFLPIKKQCFIKKKVATLSALILLVYKESEYLEMFDTSLVKIGTLCQCQVPSVNGLIDRYVIQNVELIYRQNVGWITKFR